MTNATPKYQGLTPREYSKSYAYGALMAAIGIAAGTAYTVVNLHYFQYFFVINSIGLLASIGIIIVAKDIDVRMKICFFTAFMLACLSFPIFVQNMIRSETPDIMKPSEYIINNKIVSATPKYIINNYWSSNALYASVINTIYDQRSIYVALNTENGSRKNLNIRVNDYADYETMKKIIKKTYSD